MSEVEQCDAQLNFPFCGRVLCSVAYGQSKCSANVPLMLKSRSDPAFILNVSSRPIFSPFVMKLLNKCLN